MPTTRLRPSLALLALLTAAACTAPPPPEPLEVPRAAPPSPGLPMAFLGDWYGADGQLLRVAEHALGEWKVDGIDGTFADGLFLFADTSFSGRSGAASCRGTLKLADGGLAVDLKGPCGELNGRWTRTPDAGPPRSAALKPKPAPPRQEKTSAAKPPPPKATPKVDQCERYVDCVCDVVIAIRHRGGDDSYMISCDTARALADLGASQKNCKDGLAGMAGWFAGIEATYPRVEIPRHCKK